MSAGEWRTLPAVIVDHILLHESSLNRTFVELIRYWICEYLQYIVCFCEFCFFGLLAHFYCTVSFGIPCILVVCFFRDVSKVYVVVFLKTCVRYWNSFLVCQY